MKPLSLAMPKGRLLKPALQLFRELGLQVDLTENGSRKLIVHDPASGMRFILLKPADVLTAVEYGAADLGIVGQDVLREQEADVFEPLTFPFGQCRLALAGAQERKGTAWWLLPSLRVATKYPRLTIQFFSRHGWSAETIAMNGSVEIAPALGLSDLIVDIVDSGRTLRENGLVEYAEVMKSQAALIVNRAAYTLRQPEITSLMNSIKSTAVMAAHAGKPGAAPREGNVEKSHGSDTH
ncbi:MAG: ATP phosphoribosyltransferase [Anaerolineae bacterium]